MHHREKRLCDIAHTALSEPFGADALSKATNRNDATTTP